MGKRPMKEEVEHWFSQAQEKSPAATIGPMLESSQALWREGDIRAAWWIVEAIKKTYLLHPRYDQAFVDALGRLGAALNKLA